MTEDWVASGVDMSDLDLAGDGLREHWDWMHAGNREPYPENEQLREAWRQYHLGDFAGAVETGRALGGPGIVPAAFAGTIYAQYVEQDEQRKPRIFQQVMTWCEEAETAGLSTPNLHYMYAVTMGRYSQFISLIDALAQGFGGRIKEQTEKCLALDNEHAEGHVTFGGWNAEISDQAGTMMAKVLYGATRDAAIEHYETALQLAPDSPIPCIEYARGLETMYGDNRREQIIALLEQGLEKQAADAMQRLDQAKARLELAVLKT